MKRSPRRSVMQPSDSPVHWLRFHTCWSRRWPIRRRIPSGPHHPHTHQRRTAPTTTVGATPRGRPIWVWLYQPQIHSPAGISPAAATTSCAGYCLTLLSCSIPHHPNHRPGNIPCRGAACCALFITSCTLRSRRHPTPPFASSRPGGDRHSMPHDPHDFHRLQLFSNPSAPFQHVKSQLCPQD